MNQAFVPGVNQVIPITLKVNKNMSEQTKRRGRRLSIIGLFQKGISFVYGLAIGGVKRRTYIEMMEKEALFAYSTGRMRVIVQDNGPIHRCLEVGQLWSKWEQMGLYIFFLPKYCTASRKTEMNPIELEWQHLKKDVGVAAR